MQRRHTLVFYDGACGLCHGAVRFALRRDVDGSRFRFAPLQGETLRRELGPEPIADLADSIVVRGVDGQVLQESDAVLFLLRQLGGGWLICARLAALIPRWLRDLAYRGVAKARLKLFPQPPHLCPEVPAELRVRFLP